MISESYGWAGKILRVDLSERSIQVEPLDEYTGQFLGGRAVNMAILVNEVPPGTSAFDPENRLVFGAGTLCGTLAPSSGRLAVACLNAQTGGVCSSNSGGHFAPELKYAGYDHIIVQGAAEDPVYLWINDQCVELRDARPLWGRDTWATHAWLVEELGDEHLHTALIGPAGENLVRGACIVVDRTRTASRGGLGAVMGSKKLKGIAVRGRGAIRVAEAEPFMQAVHQAWWALANSGPQGLEHKGGSHLVGSKPCNSTSLFSVRNAQDGYWAEEKIDRVDYPVFEAQYEKRRVANFACPTYCSHVNELKFGRYAPLIDEGMEANAVWGAARLDIDHAPWLPKFHAMLSQYGVDNDFAVNVIGWAMELYEKGLITQIDTGGLDLSWGNHRSALEMLEKITYRQGLGDLLAEGVMRASQQFGQGSEQFAIHVKGADFIEEFRATIGWGLGVVTAPRGGGHLDGAPLPETMGYPDILAQRLFDAPTFDPQVYEGKAKIVKWHEAYKNVIDSVGLCYFASSWNAIGQRIGLPEIACLVSAATGRATDPDELLEIGRRAHNLQKAFNTLHAGFTRLDDLPPRRFLEEPIRSGPFAGAQLDLHKWNRLLDDYYELHGWDQATGWQTRSCLEQLGLHSVAGQLEQVGRLPI